MSSDDQDAGMTARDIFVREMMTHFDGEAAWAVAVTSDIEQARDYCEIADAILSALTEAGLCIVEREDVAKAADAVLDLMSRREMQAFRHEWVDVHRRMTAAVASGAEDAP